MWVEGLSHSSSKEPPQPVAEQADPEWPHLLWSSAGSILLKSWKQFIHAGHLQQCLHSWNGNLPVSDAAFWAGISLSMLRDLATHSAIGVAFLKEHVGEMNNQKAAELGSSVCLLQKISNPFKAFIGGIIFVSADQKLIWENKNIFGSSF